MSVCPIPSYLLAACLSCRLTQHRCRGTWAGFVCWPGLSAQVQHHAQALFCSWARLRHCSAPGRRVPAAELSGLGSRAHAVGATCAPHQGSEPHLGSISAVSSLLIASVRTALAMPCVCTCTATPRSLGFHLAKCPCSSKPGMAGTATQRQFFVFSLMWQDKYSAETSKCCGRWTDVVQLFDTYTVPSSVSYTGCGIQCIQPQTIGTSSQMFLGSLILVLETYHLQWNFRSSKGGGSWLPWCTSYSFIVLIYLKILVEESLYWKSIEQNFIIQVYGGSGKDERLCCLAIRLKVTFWTSSMVWGFMCCRAWANQLVLWSQVGQARASLVPQCHTSETEDFFFLSTFNIN